MIRTQDGNCGEMSCRDDSSCPKSVTLVASMSLAERLRELAVYRKKTLLLALAIALGLGACHHAPDADYLRDYVQAHDLMDAYNGRGDELVRAQEIIEALLKRQPDLPHAHVEMARLLMKRDHIVSERFIPGTLEHAEQELRTAISLDDQFCDGHVVLGYVLYLMHKYPDALHVLDRADALACPSPWRLMNRIDVDMALQRFDDASAALAKVPATLENVTPTLRASIEAKARMTQVWIAFSKGDQAGMLEQLRQQVKVVPHDDAWSIGNAAESFVLAGAFEEAVDTAREALRRMNYGAARRTLGVALFGDSLWRSSRAASPQDQRAADEWTEAESLVEFDDAGKQLWGSMANRDVAFRALLQTKIAENRTAQDAK